MYTTTTGKAKISTKLVDEDKNIWCTVLQYDGEVKAVVVETLPLTWKTQANLTEEYVANIFAKNPDLEEDLTNEKLIWCYDVIREANKG